MTAAIETVANMSLRVPGGILAADQARAQALLEDASALIRSVANKSTWDQATAPDIAKMICIAAAKRAFMKPDMVQSETIVAYTATFASAPASVYLTAQEKNALRRAAGRSGLWVQPTTRTDHKTGDVSAQIPDVPSPWPDGYMPSDDPVTWPGGDPTP